MSEIKKLTIEESIMFRDAGVNETIKKGGLQGVVVVRDHETGLILPGFPKPNLVVRDGREMTMRKIFNIPGAVAGETAAQLGAKNVLLFGIGTGGTPNNDPFSPFPPTPSDHDLTSAVAFQTSSAANPLALADAPNYTDGRSASGGTTAWYKKLFSNGNGIITVDPVADQVYCMLDLQISSLDARDQFVNELALYWTQVNPAAGDPNSMYSNYFMFSRITFLTVPLPSATNKALDIQYFVYL